MIVSSEMLMKLFSEIAHFCNIDNSKNKSLLQTPSVKCLYAIISELHFTITLQYVTKTEKIQSDHKSVCRQGASTCFFLWFATAGEPWVEADFPDVVSVEEPAEEPLHPQAVASVGAGSELPLVGVPVVGLRVQTLLLVGRDQLVVVVHTHASADDLACRNES